MNNMAIVPRLLVINENMVVRDRCVIIQDGVIRSIDKSDRVREYGADHVIKGDDIAAIPALANSHTHISERLLSGVGDGLGLYSWLREVVWPHGEKLMPEYAYYLAKLSALEYIKTGIALVNDMFVSHNDSPVLGEVARALAEAGLRGVLGRGINEASGYGEVAFRDSIDAAKLWDGYDGRLRISLAPTLIHANSEDMLNRIRETASSKGMMIHIHVAETIEEYRSIKSKHGCTPVEYLDKLSFLGRDVIAAHLVWLGPRDVEIIKRRDVGVAHNPLSNARLANGSSPIWELLRSGIRVGLGSDGSASSDNQDLFAAMRMAALSPRLLTLNPSALTTRQTFAMATRLGYETLGFRGGEIREGFPADIAIIDLHHPSMFPVNDIVSQLVLSSHPGVVKGLVVAGKLLYYDGRYFTLNKNEIYRRVSEIRLMLGVGC